METTRPPVHQPERAWCQNTTQKYDAIYGLQDTSIELNPVERMRGVCEMTALVHTESLRARTAACRRQPWPIDRSTMYVPFVSGVFG